MESHGVTCHPAEVTFPPLPQPKPVLDVATPEGCKAELTCKSSPYSITERRVLFFCGGPWATDRFPHPLKTGPGTTPEDGERKQHCVAGRAGSLAVWPMELSPPWPPDGITKFCRDACALWCPSDGRPNSRRPTRGDAVKHRQLDGPFRMCPCHRPAAFADHVQLQEIRSRRKTVKKSKKVAHSHSRQPTVGFRS